MAPFYGWCSTISRLEVLQGGSLLFTTKFSEISGTHFMPLMVNLPVIITLRIYCMVRQVFYGCNLFTTPFNRIFGKIHFFENCQHKFYFCQCEIDNTTFASAFFADVK